MKDSISIERVDKLHPKTREIFKSFVRESENELGITLRVVQGLRTFPEQHTLFLQRPKVTNADAGYSYHNYGLAIDLVEIKDGKANWNFDYSKLLPIAKKYNLVWGGSFKSIVDKPHYELSFGYSVKQLLDKYNKKDFIEGNYVSI